MSVNSPGVLVVAGTPIGDVDDAPPALGRELAAADVVAAEDTVGRAAGRRIGSADRWAGRLVLRRQRGGSDAVSGRGSSSGERVLLVSDAGMPSVSDPGYRLVEAAGRRRPGDRRAGPVGGARGARCRGLPADRFCFEDSFPGGPVSATVGSRRWRVSSGRWCSSSPAIGSPRRSRRCGTRWASSGTPPSAEN